MTKAEVAQIVKDAQLQLSKHSPEILMGIGIASLITTTLLAVKNTPKAIKLLEKKKQETGTDELPPVEVVKTAWKCYIPAVVSGVFGVACLVGANSVHVQRNAALATVYKISETALSEYRDKVVETIGEKKESVVRDKVEEEHIKKTPIENNEVIVTDGGTFTCFDSWSGRYFKSSETRIMEAANTLNDQMLHQITGYASLNDFYDELGLPHTEVGDMIGWNTEHLVKIHPHYTKMNDGTPGIAIVHDNRPIYEYDR